MSWKLGLGQHDHYTVELHAQLAVADVLIGRHVYGLTQESRLAAKSTVKHACTWLFKINGRLLGCGLRFEDKCEHRERMHALLAAELGWFGLGWEMVGKEGR